ncbi:MAG: MEDS domain-containing protein [Candidatus Loosdrechtia sp.]|uniref:MEDS domain-containing protein n=1 Tax=Candidatus Loosdrechtia sp. TaxID=3101272 RepID=UPI003A5E6E22|nr:MAG: MEDS domain-containing protein [Candidatus Jettenia sp. AMX2]
MTEFLRKTGIEIIGNAPWGTHFCQLYQTKEDLVDLLVPYFKSGLASNEFCMWLTSEPLAVPEAVDAMKKTIPDFESLLAMKKIEIVPSEEWYLKDGIFEKKRAINIWINKLNQALKNGYEGMRITDNTTWLKKKDWKNFTDYEEVIDSVIDANQIIAICSYSLNRCNAYEITDVFRNHQFALMKREGKLEIVESSKQKDVKAALRISEKRLCKLANSLGEYSQLVTALKKSEERLCKFSSAIEQSPCSVIITNNEGVIEYVNPKFSQLTGYTRDEVAGNNARILKSGKTPAEEYKRLWSTITSGNIWKGEFVNKKKNGELYWELASVSPVKDPEGRITHFVAIKEDITERKQVENELRRQRDKLEHITSQLTAANKELEAFCYSVSHDLRAPLRSIDGFSKALIEDYADRLDDEGKNHLLRVRAASQRMGQLIEDLLNLSRITQAGMYRKTINLSELVATVASELQERQPERKVEFIISRGLVANADPRLLKIALENLLGNAWKYTKPCSEAKIEFGVTQHNGKPAYFVRDNGVGFDMTYIGRLFVAFQRLHSANEFEGTGIGLATVQRIIHRHGGQIWAEGEIGKGAVFYFTIQE